MPTRITNFRQYILDNVKIVPYGCWEWQRKLSKEGYGRIGINYKVFLAHRVSYTIFKGSIPDGIDIDHLCRNRKCQNPDHLELVTRGENVRRGMAWKVSGMLQRAKTHCPHGHPYSEENTIIVKDKKGNYRSCRVCRSIKHRQKYAEMRKSGRRTMPKSSACLHGHPYTEASLGHAPDGQYYCRVCHKLRARANKSKQRAMG